MRHFPSVFYMEARNMNSSIMWNHVRNMKKLRNNDSNLRKKENIWESLWLCPYILIFQYLSGKGTDQT